MRKLGCVPPQFAANTSLMCRNRLDQALFDEEVNNYFYDVAIDSEPSNCSKPCTTLHISTTLTGQTPRMAGSIFKLIMDKEVTVVVVRFSMDIFKLTAELGGFLGLGLSVQCLTCTVRLHLFLLILRICRCKQHKRKLQLTLKF